MKKASIWVITAAAAIILQDINTWLISKNFQIALRIPNVPISTNWYFLLAIVIAVLIFLFMFWVVYVIDYVYPFFIMDDLFKIRNKSPFMYHAISKVVMPISSFIGGILKKRTESKDDTRDS